jgi:hypothetical protein
VRLTKIIVKLMSFTTQNNLEKILLLMELLSISYSYYYSLNWKPVWAFSPTQSQSLYNKAFVQKLQAKANTSAL